MKVLNKKYTKIYLNKFFCNFVKGQTEEQTGFGFKMKIKFQSD